MRLYNFCCWFLVLSYYNLIIQRRVNNFMHIKILEPKMSSILNKVPRTDDRNVYSVAIGWSSLMISICSILYIVQFHSYSFCLFGVGLVVYLFDSRWSISERGILKLPTITLGLSLPLSAVSTQCLYPQSNLFHQHVVSLFVSLEQASLQHGFLG